MHQVRRYVDDGIPIPDAIKMALKIAGYPTIKQFAAARGFRRDQTSNMLTGGVRPSQALLDALVETLGGTQFEWRRLLWQAGEPIADRVEAHA